MYPKFRCFPNLDVFTDLGVFVLPKQLQVWARPYTNIYKSKMQIREDLQNQLCSRVPGEGPGWRVGWGAGQIRAPLPALPLALVLIS